MTFRPNVSASRLTTVLTILLGLAYLLVLSGRIAEDDSPIAQNTSSGGLSAFAGLLRASGYRVRIEDSLRPRFSSEEFVIVPLENPGRYRDAQGSESESGTPDAGALLKRLPATPGGALVFSQSAEIRVPADRTYTNVATSETFRVRTGQGAESVPGTKSIVPLTPLFSDGTSDAGIETAEVEGRRLTIVRRGELATNQYIDVAQNAAMLSGLVRASAGRRQIVIYQGLSSQGGLLSALGDWAFAARNQAILAIGLLVVSLGSRFGLAPKIRRRETGQREQADALGNLLQRWRGPRVGIDAAIEQSRRRLSTARKLPPSTPREQWDKYLSPELIEAIEECEEWSRHEAHASVALKVIARLNGETDAEIMGGGPVRIADGAETKGEVYRQG